MKKTLITILVTVLLCGCVFGTTFAWLIAKTETIENTFTVGDINITLTETKEVDENGLRTFKMVPGNDITKDPKVTVKAGSEACWLFVKVEESTNFDTYMTYAMASGWTELTGVTGVTGVYYREVAANTNDDQPFDVLSGNIVTVKDTVTRDQLIKADTNKPTLAFTAYAVQKDNVSTAAAAWSVATTGKLPANP